jgi:hypothetical protein
MQKRKKKSVVSQKIKMTVPASVIEECRRLKQQKKGFTKYLYEKLKYNGEQIDLVLRELKKGFLDKKSSGPVEEDVEWESSLKFTDKYIYNKQDDKYIMHLKSANGNIVLPGDTVRGIKENYSNWVGEEHSINQVCRNYQIPRNYLVEILKVLGITHDSEPITDEQINERDVKDIAKDILQKKKFNLYQEFQKRSWKETEEDASKWRRLQEGVIDPFTNFINSWNPPPREKVSYKGSPVGNKPRKSFVVGLSDVHFGAKSNPKDSYRNKGYSTQDAVNYIKKYVQEIKEAVESRNYHFDECVLAAMGDILHTTGAGFTTKGTMLVHDCIKEEQFASAFNSIVLLIDSLLEIFPKVRVNSVKGNHNDFGDWVLFKTLEAYYRTEPRISIDVFQTDHGLFKVKSTLFVISHGYSAEYKGRLPSGKERERYIANLFLSRPEELIGAKQKVLLTADQHHLEMKEYAEFEHYMLSTVVKGDKHSDAFGLNNIARQSCFVVDETGIKEIVYCYS